MAEQGTLSIHAENILPIIKKWLYSDHEIFLRELVSNGVAMLNNGPDNDGDTSDGGDISGAPFEDMKDIRLAAAFLSNGAGAAPIALSPTATTRSLASGRAIRTWRRSRPLCHLWA